VSDFLDADCFAVAVYRPDDSLDQNEQEAIDRHLNFARNLHLETRVLEGPDVAALVVEFARLNQVTQLYLSRGEERSRWLSFLTTSLIEKIVALAKDMQIVIVSSDP
jgi:K+-sensing histidine kinase KdpD